MAIFDDVARDSSAPGDHGESYWNFLNRSARPEADRARKLIESWFSHLCPALGQGVQQRLQSGDNPDFAAGFWELYLHELFTRLEYEITCEAATPSGRNIDFLLRRGNTAFYLEATTAGQSGAKRGAEARRDRIYNEVNKLQAHNFSLSIEIEAAGTNDLKNVKGLRDDLGAWLEPLDPDRAQERDAIGEGPTFKWEDGAGWSLVLRAFPKRPNERGQPESRLLHFLVDEVSIIDDEHPLQRALERKRPSRYGALSVPYVVAISEEPFDPGEPAWHRRNLLFGRESIELRGGQPARSARRTDGKWRGPGAMPQHTRLAAVLFARGLLPWTVDKTELEWWDNPFASQPVPNELIPDVVRRCQLLVDNNGIGEFEEVEALRTPGSILRT